MTKIIEFHFLILGYWIQGAKAMIEIALKKPIDPCIKK